MMRYTAGMKKRLMMMETPSAEYISIGSLVYVAFIGKRETEYTLTITNQLKEVKMKKINRGQHRSDANCACCF